MRVEGFILWWDSRDREGVCEDFSGNSYFFNEWSFSGTIYNSTKSRLFPGLFRDRHTTPDKRCDGLKTNFFITFKYLEGFGATEIELIPKRNNEVLGFRLSRVLDSLLETEEDTRIWYRDIWLPYYENRMRNLLIELDCLEWIS